MTRISGFHARILGAYFSVIREGRKEYMYTALTDVNFPRPTPPCSETAQLRGRRPSKGRRACMDVQGPTDKTQTN